MQHATNVAREIHTDFTRFNYDDRVYRLLKKLAYANGEVRRRMRSQQHGVVLCEFTMADETCSPYQCHLMLKCEELFVHSNRRYFWDGGYEEGGDEPISFDDAASVIQICGMTHQKLEEQLYESCLISGLNKKRRKFLN